MSQRQETCLSSKSRPRVSKETLITNLSSDERGNQIASTFGGLAICVLQWQVEQLRKKKGRGTYTPSGNVGVAALGRGIIWPK
jgi:hypothetical protein